jgi:hypothetical protein
MPATAKAEWHSRPLESKWDRGRRIITLVKLAGGAGILMTSVISITAAVFGTKTTDSIDVLAALIGALVAFGFFATRFHVFTSHAAGDVRKDVNRRNMDQSH